MLFFSLLSHLFTHIVEPLFVGLALGLLVDLHFLQVFQIVLSLVLLLSSRLLELLIQIFLSSKSFLQSSCSGFKLIELLLNRQNFFQRGRQFKSPKLLQLRILFVELDDFVGF